MTDHVLARVDGIKSALDLFIEQTNLPAMTIDEVRLAILKEFEENDKRRGVPYLAHTPKVSDTVRIEYTDKVEFGQGEEPFVVGIYSDDFLNGMVSIVQPTGVVKEEPFTDQHEYDTKVETGDVDEEGIGWTKADSSYVDSPVEVSDSDDGDSGEELEPSDDGEYDDVDSDDDDLDEDDSNEDDSDEDDSDESEEEPTHEVSPLAFLSAFKAEKLEKSPEVKAPVLQAPNKPKEIVRTPQPRVEVPGPPPPHMRPKSVAPEVVRPEKIIKTEPPKLAVVAPVKSKPTTTKDAFDDFDNMFSGVSDVVEKKPQVRREVRDPAAVRKLTVVSEAKTVRELVKNNPGCSIEFAKQFFPEREIKKQISVGRIYYKNGKLTI